MNQCQKIEIMNQSKGNSPNETEKESIPSSPERRQETESEVNSRL